MRQHVRTVHPARSAECPFPSPVRIAPMCFWLVQLEPGRFWRAICPKIIHRVLGRTFGLSRGCRNVLWVLQAVACLVRSTAHPVFGRAYCRHVQEFASAGQWFHVRSMTLSRLRLCFAHVWMTLVRGACCAHHIIMLSLEHKAPQDTLTTRVSCGHTFCGAVHWFVTVYAEAYSHLGSTCCVGASVCCAVHPHLTFCTLEQRVY